MDLRCTKFWEDGQSLVQAAGAGPQQLPYTMNKMLKEVTTMSRFLQRNQSQRFSDNAQQKSVDAIAMYVAFSKQLVPIQTKDVQKLVDETFKVVKDGLAMPFNVFGTKQKKRLLKWHNELIAIVGGDQDGALQIEGLDGAAAATAAPRVIWSVLDMDSDGYLSLLNDTSGETCESFQLAKKSAEFKQIKKALEKAEITVVTVGDDVAEVSVTQEESMN